MTARRDPAWPLENGDFRGGSARDWHDGTARLRRPINAQVFEAYVEQFLNAHAEQETERVDEDLRAGLRSRGGVNR